MLAKNLAHTVAQMPIVLYAQLGGLETAGLEYDPGNEDEMLCPYA